MKTSNKIILLVCLLLIGSIPISANLLKKEYDRKTKNRTNPLDRQINVVVIDNLFSGELHLSQGKNKIDIPYSIIDSIYFECRKDTLFIKEKESRQKISVPALNPISLNLKHCPDIIIGRGGMVVIKEFSEVKNNLFFKSSVAGVIKMENSNVDSIDLSIQHGSQFILMPKTTLNYLSVKATDYSFLSLGSEEIKTIEANVEPNVRVEGSIKNIEKLISEK